MKMTYVTLNQEMARAYRGGRKSMMHILIKPQPDPDMKYGGVITMSSDRKHEGVHYFYSVDNVFPSKHMYVKCSYGGVGDQLILGTTWAVHEQFDHLRPIDLPFNSFNPVCTWSYFDGDDKPDGFGKLRSGRFLPKKLRHHMPAETITVLSAERVQEITEEDCYLEGFEYERARIEKLVNTWSFGESKIPDFKGKGIDWFHALWDKTPRDKGYNWDNNPYNWAIGWERRNTK